MTNNECVFLLFSLFIPCPALVFIFFWIALRAQTSESSLPVPLKFVVWLPSFQDGGVFI